MLYKYINHIKIQQLEWMRYNFIKLVENFATSNVFCPLIFSCLSSYFTLCISIQLMLNVNMINYIIITNVQSTTSVLQLHCNFGCVICFCSYKINSIFSNKMNNKILWIFSNFCNFVYLHFNETTIIGIGILKYG